MEWKDLFRPIAGRMIVFLAIFLAYDFILAGSSGAIAPYPASRHIPFGLEGVCGMYAGAMLAFLEAAGGGMVVLALIFGIQMMAMFVMIPVLVACIAMCAAAHCNGIMKGLMMRKKSKRAK